MGKLKTITVGFTSEEGGRINLLELPMTEVEILTEAIRNCEGGFTIIEPPKMRAEYKCQSIFFLKDPTLDPFITEDNLKYIFDCSFENFRPNHGRPSWWIRFQLRVILFLGI